MNYEEALQHINNTPKFSKILGNDDLKKLLAHLGNPESCLSFIHIAGTNGKGSVCAMCASVMQAAGFKTGLYTSPFIELFNERIQINGKNIPDDTLARIATRVKSAAELLNIEISVFAQITAMAFLYFAEENCDIVILETGLGGRLDATNVITAPKACAITKIGFDHTEYLGDTLEKIALEKCGIIKRGVPVVTCFDQPETAMSVIKAECEKKSAPLITAAKETTYTISLKGNYQHANAAVAAELARIMGISERDIKTGLANTFWPARFEFLSDNLILDGAHNPDGISALISALSELKKPIIFVVAMMRDKDFEDSAAMLNAFSDCVIVTQIDIPRCIPAGELAGEFNSPKVIPNAPDAVRYACSVANSGSVVCVCGSLYLAGEIRRNFK